MNQNLPDPRLYNLPFTTDEFNGMPYQRLGNSGLQVSRIGLGAWKYGYPETGDGARVNQEEAFKIFDRAIELGVTFWDTANRYNASSGNSERVIGNWLAANPGQRRNVVIATKLFGGMDGFTPNHCRLSRLNILEAAYASLERLQLDTIDLLYFHAHENGTPVEESLTAIEDLVRQDLVRYFAVSNFTVEQIKTYQQVEKSLSCRCRITAVQNQFDILDKESPQYAGVLEYAAQSGFSFIAWSPLARGLLTGRYLEPAQVGPGDRLFDEETLDKDLSKGHLEKVRQLNQIAGEIGVELSQLALAYMLTLSGMGPVIPGISGVSQLEENAKAGTLKLEGEICRQVEQVVGS